MSREVADQPFSPEMLGSSPRIAPALPLLRTLPRPASAALLAGLTIAEGLTNGRFRLASDWAGGLGHGPIARRWTALCLLANHGRFVADEAALGLNDLDALKPARVEGAERVRDVEGGALLLGFHLGPPRIWLSLRAAGLPARMVARFEESRRDPRWSKVVATGDVIPMPRDEAGRLQALYRIRSLLRQKALVMMPADGNYGREAFRLELPGRPLIVRGGWLTLRRQTNVPTFPILAGEEKGQRVIAIHPPLPPVDADVARDIEACRAALTPLLTDYVRRYPRQCRYLAFPPWSS